MICSGRRSEERVISLGLLNCDEVLLLQASRLCSPCAVIDQRLQFKDLKPLSTLLWWKWDHALFEFPGDNHDAYRCEMAHIKETHAVHWVTCITGLLPTAGSLCSCVFLLQGEISRRECDSSQCFAICLSCLLAHALGFFTLIFKVPRELHPKCIFELLMPCIPFQSWQLGERDSGPKGFLKWNESAQNLFLWSTGCVKCSSSRAQMCHKFSILKNVRSTYNRKALCNNTFSCNYFTVSSYNLK